MTSYFDTYYNIEKAKLDVLTEIPSGQRQTPKGMNGRPSIRLNEINLTFHPGMYQLHRC